MSTPCWPIDEQEGMLRVRVPPRAGTLGSSPLSDEIQRIIQLVELKPTKSVVVDFTACPFFGSAMLEGLLQIKRSLDKKQVRVALCGLTADTEEIIRIARFDQLIPVYADFDEAVRAM